jgi:hypothetical protein
MSAVAITGDDTLTLSGHVFHDLADGDCGKLEYEEDLTKLKVGKDGNAVYGQNQMGRAGTLTMRVVMGSADDIFLQGLLGEYLLSPSAYVLDAGSLFKTVGDGTGVTHSVVYQILGGAPKKQPMVKINTEGDPEQSVREWTWLVAQIQSSVI